MARDISVHIGTSEDGLGRKRACAWVVTSIRLEAEGHDLANALGSRYFRNGVTDDECPEGSLPEGLPCELTQRQILAIYREEFAHWGENLSTWSDELSDQGLECAHKWMKELIGEAFPEMKKYMN
ncbi:hypothetical protein [Streptomyces cucumeris]|uniref:hypothetical protein n=1 Tax=Streptomyces cucumeris TaxID=2962890 RepID=UPI0020C89D89|nr:hypothetical protein [Streptomyces sp. NEAU-Y11]MCP9209582.1 hypothetical protein [Streptomyces sp. NEAU-Y11]